MMCSACRTHFCFLCGAWLSSHTPYSHYNDPKSPCNQLLFFGSRMERGMEQEGGENGADGENPMLDDDGDGEIPQEALAWMLGND